MTQNRTFIRTRLIDGDEHRTEIVIRETGWVTTASHLEGKRIRSRRNAISRGDVPGFVRHLLETGYREATPAAEPEPESPYSLKQIPDARPGEQWAIFRDGRAVIRASRAECGAVLRGLNLWLKSERNRTEEAVA